MKSNYRDFRDTSFPVNADMHMQFIRAKKYLSQARKELLYVFPTCRDQDELLKDVTCSLTDAYNKIDKYVTPIARRVLRSEKLEKSY